MTSHRVPKTRLENRRQRVRLPSEAARREVLIAPVLLEIADITQAIVNTQLATELIALDQWVELNDPILYGAITTGDIWHARSSAHDQGFENMLWR